VSTVLLVGLCGTAQAHLGEADGVRHAAEHLLLLLGLPPLLIVLRPLLRRARRP
jgi:hypothetical protein